MEDSANHIPANHGANAPNGFLDGRILVQELAAFVIFDDFAVAVDMQMVSRQHATRLLAEGTPNASQPPASKAGRRFRDNSLTGLAVPPPKVS